MSISVNEIELVVKELSEARLDYEAKRKIASDANNKVESIESKICEMLNDLEKDSYKSEYGTVSLSYRSSYKVPQGDQRQVFFDYLKGVGAFDGLITVNSATLNAWTKAQLEAAKEKGEVIEIPGLGDPTVTPGIRFLSKK